MDSCQFLVLLIGSSHNTKLSLHKGFIQKQCCITLVIVIVLAVRGRAVISYFISFSHINPAHCCTVNDALKSHFFKILYRLADDPLESQAITDIDGSFLLQILFVHLKSDPISFRKYRCDPLDLCFRKTVQKFAHADLPVCDILAELIKVGRIRKICLHNNISCKRQGRIQLLPDPVTYQHITVIADKPVHILLKLPFCGQISFCKFTVDL